MPVVLVAVFWGEALFCVVVGADAGLAAVVVACGYPWMQALRSGELAGRDALDPPPRRNGSPGAAP